MPSTSRRTPPIRQPLSSVYMTCWPCIATTPYAALHPPPSLLDQFLQWARDRLDQLLRLLFGGAGGAQVPSWFFYIVGAVVLIAGAGFFFFFSRVAGWAERDTAP